MIIGINLNHDYAYCLIDDNGVYLREQERFSRIRYHENASSFTLAILDDFSIDELKKVEAIYLTSPRVRDIMRRGGDLSSEARRYTYVGDYVLTTTQLVAHGKLLVEGLSIPCAWVSHYHAHAASSFWASSFADADIICLDGGGEDGEGAWFYGKGNEISLIHCLEGVMVGSSYHHFSHRVYNTTNGFYESKVMAIASYGKREYCRNSYLSSNGHLNSISPDVSPTVHDVADFQYQFEQFVLGLLQQANRKSENLCCAGGCFLNVTLNRVIADSGLYKSIYVPPYAGDMGTAIGCALYAAHDTHRQLPNPALLDTAFLGDDISTDLHQLRAVISSAGDIPIDQTHLKNDSLI